jgi:RecA/RadA recombinase
MARKKDLVEQIEESQDVKKAKTSADIAKAFLKKYNKNEFASTLNESRLSNVGAWISSGSFSLNRVLSGSYKKGFANNRLYVIAGPSSTGKSLVCARTVAEAQKAGYQIFYFDSENAIDNDFMERFGVDTSSLIYQPVKTISEFRNLAVQLMRDWRKDPETKDIPALFFCDSIGGLAGTKEMNDVEEGKNASDMGQRAKELRATARILTIECAHNMIPMIVTNHTYEQSAANPQAAPITKMSGGEGFMYASSAVIYLKKREHKEAEQDALGENVKVKKGNFLIATAAKNRFVPEGTKGEIYINFEKGVSPYYGLLEDAVAHGFIEIKGQRYYIKHLDKTFFEKQLYTKDVWNPIIEDLNKKVEETFKFATVAPIEEETEDDTEGDDASIETN